MASVLIQAASAPRRRRRRRSPRLPPPLRPPTSHLLLQVHLCGSFTRWVETVPMQPVEGQPGTFAVVVHLPPG